MSESLSRYMKENAKRRNFPVYHIDEADEIKEASIVYYYDHSNRCVIFKLKNVKIRAGDGHLFLLDLQKSHLKLSRDPEIDETTKVLVEDQLEELKTNIKTHLENDPLYVSIKVPEDFHKRPGMDIPYEISFYDRRDYFFRKPIGYNSAYITPIKVDGLYDWDLFFDYIETGSIYDRIDSL